MRFLSHVRLGAYARTIPLVIGAFLLTPGVSSALTFTDLRVRAADTKNFFTAGVTTLIGDRTDSVGRTIDTLGTFAIRTGERIASGVGGVSAGATALTAQLNMSAASLREAIFAAPGEALLAAGDHAVRAGESTREFAGAVIRDAGSASVTLARVPGATGIAVDETLSTLNDRVTEVIADTSRGGLTFANGMITTPGAALLSAGDALARANDTLTARILAMTATVDARATAMHDTITDSILTTASAIDTRATAARTALARDTAATFATLTTTARDLATTAQDAALPSTANLALSLEGIKTSIVCFFTDCSTNTLGPVTLPATMPTATTTRTTTVTKTPPAAPVSAPTQTATLKPQTPAPLTITTPQPEVVTKVIQTTVLGATDTTLDAKLAALRAELLAELSRVRQTTSNNYQAISISNRIDSLTDATLVNPTIRNAVITGTSLGATSGSFSGTLSVGGTGTSTFSSDVAFDTDTLYVDSLNNRVGIGTSSPSDTLALNGALYLAQISAPSVTTNRLYNQSGSLYWNGTALGAGGGGSSAFATTTSQVASRLIVYPLNTTDILTVGASSTTTAPFFFDPNTTTGYMSGNLGIGTTSPYAKLSVVGNVVADAFVATSTTATSTFGGGFAVGTNGLVYDRSTNYVGIGTASPSAKLTVTTGDDYGLRHTNGTVMLNTYVDGTSGWFGTSSSHPLYFMTNDAAVAGLTTSGRLGIGLNVYSNPQATIHSGATSGAQLRLSYVPGSSDVDFTVGSSAFTINTQAGSTAFDTVFPAGKIGIGTTSPYAKLSVVGEVVARNFTATSTTATSTFAGAVGIGTTDPIGALDVAGGVSTVGGEGKTVEIAGYLNSPFISAGEYQNYLQYTEDFSNAVWARTNISSPIDDVEVDPRGWSDSATRVATGTTATASLSQAITNSSTGTWTFSVWLRARFNVTATSSLRIDSSAETGTAKTITLTNKWKRYSVTQTFTSANTTKTVYIVTGTNAAIAAFGAQLEPSSYARAYSGIITDTPKTTLSSAAVINGYLDLPVDGSSITVGTTNVASSTIQVRANNGQTFGVNIMGTTGYDVHGLLINTLDSGTNKIGNIRFSRNSLPRWTIKKDDTAETGNNAGSWLTFQAHDDTFGTIGNALALKRDLSAEFGGKVGIGSSTPFAKLVITGTTGSTTPLFRIASSTEGVLFTAEYNGNIGIGTSSPYAKLSVVGETVADYFTATSTTATSTFANHISIASGKEYRIGGVPVLGYTVGGTTYIGTGNTVSATGVAIGQANTSNSTASLAIGSGNTASSLVSVAIGLTNQATSSLAVAVGYNNRAGGTSSFVAGSGNSVYADGAVAIGNSIINTTTSSLMIGPSDAAKLTILSSGNLGIGTTSPYAKLSVAGQVVADYFTATSTTATSTFANHISIASGASYRINGAPVISGSASTGLIGFNNSIASSGWAIGSGNTSNNILSVAIGRSNQATSAGAVAFGYTNTASGDSSTAVGSVNFATAGNTVAIGYSNTASATGAIAIGSTITNATADSLMIGPSDAAKLTILSSGNLGIGTTSPYTKLSVAGSIVSDTIFATSTAATSTFAGGVNIGNGAFVYDYSSQAITAGNIELGSLSFDTDAGMVGWIDMPVTASSTTGTVHSYTAQLDGTALLSVYGLSDGAGGIKQSAIGIGTTTPAARLTVTTATSTENLPLFLVASSTGSTLFSILNSGYVGIGTTTAAVNNALVVQGGVCITAGTTCPTVSSGSLRIDTAGVAGGDDPGDVFDLAERYPASEVMEPGDIAVIDVNGTPATVKRGVSGDTALGIVSTRAAIAINGSDLTLAPGHEATSTKPLVALSGRVPVKVTLEGGAIEKGDRITLSSTPGVGMKANTSAYTVGIALDTFDESSEKDSNGIGKVLVFVNLSWSRIDPAVADGSILTTSTAGSAFWNFDDTNGRLNFVTPINLNNFDIVGVRAIRSFTNQWSIDEGGKLVVGEVEAQKVTTQTLCVDDVCIEKDTLRALLQRNGLSGTPSTGESAGTPEEVSDTGSEGEAPETVEQVTEGELPSEPPAEATEPPAEEPAEETTPAPAEEQVVPETPPVTAPEENPEAPTVEPITTE